MQGDIFCDPESAFTAFYRAYNGPTVDHFYTTSVTELDNAVNQLGYSAEGITRRVLTAESACPYIKSEPLYRAYSTTAFDHFYTTSESEWNNAIVNLGYNREGIAGYVYADQVCDSIPLFRTYGAAGTDYFYTANEQEYDGVVEGGFADEGIVGYILPA
ncbi:uncharacterized protein STEHIDRAFT_69486 [Stereum hirsutum FP-91666 SS1]|uniref:DUF5648 domain-containing protein n=1 Tax=Stereum hirsutum (strain FP-91666) TaxID=721885 RepID=R7RW38_STEHR|nr:uncharacterized protein STEHIDRAFT_69486 [Stereum hirsutum FP-91666 SS1]EIM79479.1 hypothetical protein STEHIDRAFT_69486 [Stereum hirsutum FP-91666 SS1]